MSDIANRIRQIEKTLDDIRRRIGNMPVHIPTGDKSMSMFFGIIDTATEVADNRWKYAFRQVKKGGTGFGIDKWEEVAGGIAGDCYNLFEANNESTGLLGINITVEDLLGDGTCPYELLPLAIDLVLPMWIHRIGTTVEYWTCAPNSVNQAGGA